MKYILIAVFLLSSVFLNAQMVEISIYSDNSVKSLVITPFTGNYRLITDGRELNNIDEINILHLSIVNDSIRIKGLDDELGVYKKIEIIGLDTTNNNFKIKSIEPKLDERIYNDNITFTILHGRILIVNKVRLEYYIAGTVESEGGPRAGAEYYKTQAILCRTYALENWYRHEYEGFNLCDGVHCQSYRSRCYHNLEIQESTIDTKGLIIVDTALNLITAAFHSNSGGQTANSEDVWTLPKPYLRSVPDDYWQKGHNAYWTKEIPVEEWKQYLKNSGLNVPDDATALSFAFDQSSRKNYYIYNGQKISLKAIRYDWKLKSTFFSVVPEGNKLVFNGRGYGHGVGLSQEGAMRMSDMGFNYKDIIKYYFKNTFIVSLDALEFFKENSNRVE